MAIVELRITLDTFQLIMKRKGEVEVEMKYTEKFQSILTDRILVTPTEVRQLYPKVGA